jgi:O-antigen chain-terminating methyltransferase
VPDFDLLYRSFEDRHRGDAVTILERQRDDYLALLSGTPNPELRIADLGCGRGELVRLLLDEGQDAIGVDANLGQHFEQGDLFDWLDRRDDGSLRAVVAMHVVEHLPLDLQIRLVFEARRVLAPGGLLLLETPNTLSLSVAASNFWVDPTHERPVHPLFLEFLAEQAGFSTWESLPLHQMPAAFRGPAVAKELIDDLDTLILGRADMALVARR